MKLSYAPLCAVNNIEKYRNFAKFRGEEIFLERHSFRIVSDDSPETMRKLCLSTKFIHQQIR